MNCTTSYWTDHSRERQLWCAVIDRALQDATRRPAGWAPLSTEQLRERREARRWFIDNDDHYRHACESAGIDPDILRKRVLQMIAEDDRADSAAGPESFPAQRYATARR